MTVVRRLVAAHADFAGELERLLSFDTDDDSEVDRVAAAILLDVKKRRDVALLEYTERFDRHRADSVAALQILPERLIAARDGLPSAQREALEQAAARIVAYHEHQRAHSWRFTEPDGTELGQQISPLDRVGLYVPGGKAAYPSSVLMNALPAKVAGVGGIILVTPTPGGVPNPLVLAAAAVAGVDQVFAIGGAQAIAALAYGTPTIAAVDKIVGPGNAYVAAAKRRVFGVVGIDMIAGPSEVLVVADGSVDPAWVAMDLFSQAEHDEASQALLLCPDRNYLDAVEAAILELLPRQTRSSIIRSALANRCALIEVGDLAEACRLVNRIAPEHLELAVTDPEALLPAIRHAGAIFLGAYSSESLGDYCAGPNHVLPTAGTARFSSPLGVYDFQKRSSIIKVSHRGAQALGRVARELASGEGLDAHANAAAFRLDGWKREP